MGMKRDERRNEVVMAKTERGGQVGGRGTPACTTAVNLLMAVLHCGFPRMFFHPAMLLNIHGECKAYGSLQKTYLALQLQ